MTTSSRVKVLALLGVSIALLVPGLFASVLTIRGVLTRDGIAQVAPLMLERGLSDDTVAVLKSMMNPSVVAFLEATGGDVRKIVVDKLGPQISAALQQNMSEVEVYEQTRSIVGSVQRLYEVGSPVPATLILLFSVIVPLGKGASPHARRRGIRRQMVHGGRLRRRAVHRVSGGAGERDADDRTRRRARADRVHGALWTGLLLVRRLLRVFARVAAVHRPPGGEHWSGRRTAFNHGVIRGQS
jgi:hypothetical protein